jgi:hypothetical protein
MVGSSGFVSWHCDWQRLLVVEFEVRAGRAELADGEL